MKIQPARLRFINLILFGSILSVGSFACLSWIDIKQPTLPEPTLKQIFSLPYSFTQSSEAVKSVGPPFIALEKTDIKLSLPDLRTTLIYFGSTVRPDVSETAQVVQMGIRGNNTPVPVNVGSPVYLKYESKGNTGKWSFSPDNRPTPIWIEILPQDGTCEVTLSMSDSEGNKILEPADFAKFSLTLVHLPYTAQGTNAFEIAGQRADGALLVRQRCAWLGQDLFLRELGDETTNFALNKERLDFLDPENSYFSFVGVGDCLAFIDDRWEEVTPGPDSRGYPLLVAKKIDEKSISFDLWDPKGKVRVPIELRKTIIQPNTFANKFDLKLVGARSRKDWIAELGGVRMLLRADDWLILHDNTWHKITTAQELDDFINGRISGPLLVLEGSEKVGNDVSLIGKLYDQTRTQVVPLRISLFKSWEQAVPAEAADSEDEDDEDDEEDDEDDEEDTDDDDDDDDEEDDDEDLV